MEVLLLIILIRILRYRIRPEIVFCVDTYPRGVYTDRVRDIPQGGIVESAKGERFMAQKKCPHCSDRKKLRTDEEKEALLKRLRRAEGQIRGIESMIEDDTYCPDILTQVAAVTAALNSFNKELMACHMRTCVADDIRAGKDEAIDEFVKVMQKLMK